MACFLKEVVKAPEGYEGSACWIDGAREYKAYARRSGSTWWTALGYVGHSGYSKDEILQRASAEIDKCVKLGMVK